MIFLYALLGCVAANRPLHELLPSNATLGFVFSTGRIGTLFLATILYGDARNGGLVKHEDEGAHRRDVLAHILRPAMHHDWKDVVRDYVKNVKLSRIAREMRQKKRLHYLDTGHQVVLGEMSTLIKEVGSQIRVVRLRRERLATAASFAGDPTKKALCSYGYEDDAIHYCPWHQGAILKPRSIVLWKQLNLFQQYLYWVDEVEASWQQLLANTGGNFPYLEINYSGHMGEAIVKRISEFVELPYRRSMLQRKGLHHHNTKLTNRAEMARWDKGYRTVMPEGTRFSY